MTGAASVVVRVPATSANLGPGFDSLGVALSLYDEVEAWAEFGGSGPHTVRITVEGAGAGEVPDDETHLVARSMRAFFAEHDVKPSALTLACRNAIPHGRGLGSSAGAIVAGLLAARALTGLDVSDGDVFSLAARLEGHPDNVAPCLYGGFTIAWTGAGGAVRVVRSEVHADVRPVMCIPRTPLSTEAARALLPETVPHADAARNAGRAALLVEAVTRRPDLLFDATEDRLHQAYREPAMPETMALIAALRERGQPAVVSGAGPSVLVLASADEAPLVREAARGWDVRELSVDGPGAVVRERSGGHPG